MPGKRRRRKISSAYKMFFLMLCSSSYLLFLAYKIAWSGANISFSKSKRKPGIVAGVLLQLVNPKAYAVNTAMYTGFLIYPESLFFEIGIKFLIMNLIWFPIHLFWLFLGVYLKNLNLASKLQFKINLLMAVALVLVVILAFFSSFWPERLGLWYLLSTLTKFFVEFFFFESIILPIDKNKHQ